MVKDDPECTGDTINPVKYEACPYPSLLLGTVEYETSDNDEPESDMLDLSSDRNRWDLLT
jgi:hypothetical protein